MALPLAISVLTGFISSAAAETVLGVTVFTRNGDRTSKHYYDPALTNLGFQQNLQVGSDYRDLYIAANSPKQILGISEEKYLSSQIYASAPAEQVNVKSATAFLQGLYPPLERTTSETLNNGSTILAPVNGAQIPIIHAESSDSPNSIWISGAEECPVVTRSQQEPSSSASYTDKVDSTRTFYQQFWPLLKTVAEYNNKSSLSYENAYDIFDLINVGLIHNASMRDAVSTDNLLQLRTLADEHEFDKAFNSEPDERMKAIGARTLSAAITSRLNQTISSSGTTKFSLLSGGYEPMLAFFGLHDLTAASPDFYGLPEYASTMAFELLTDEDTTTFPDGEEDLKVRFLFRNGSSPDTTLKAFPLFGRAEVSLPWTDFLHQMTQVSINAPEEWCKICDTGQKPFCSLRNSYYPDSGSYDHGRKRMSNAASGVIGAVVMLGIITAAAGAAFLFLRRRWERTGPVGIPLAANIPRKGSISSLTLSIGSERVRV